LKTGSDKKTVPNFHSSNSKGKTSNRRPMEERNINLFSAYVSVACRWHEKDAR